MKPHSVVLDTNIWISFIIKSRLDELVEWVTEHEITLWSSPELVRELTEVLNRQKFSRYLTLPIADYLAFHQNLVRMLETKAVFSQSPDPKDNFLFDLALQSETLLIVTGDKRLLKVSPIDNVEIISLATFLNSI